MSGKVAARAENAKSARFRIRNQKGEIRNQISPVMQIVKSLLPAQKAAQHLALLIDEPLGNCQKLLSGDRVENTRQLTALLQSDLGKDVLFALMDGARPGWFAKYAKQLEINEARRHVKESMRRIDALQDEASE